MAYKPAVLRNSTPTISSTRNFGYQAGWEPNGLVPKNGLLSRNALGSRLIANALTDPHRYRGITL